jgi:hypothetical protein
LRVVAWPATRLHGEQFWNADQVVGDQVEHEVGGDTADAAMLGLAHRAVLLAPSENAFDHRAACLRHVVAGVAGGSRIDGAATAPAGLAGCIAGDG